MTYTLLVLIVNQNANSPSPAGTCETRVRKGEIILKGKGFLIYMEIWRKNVGMDFKARGQRGWNIILD